MPSVRVLGLALSLPLLAATLSAQGTSAPAPAGGCAMGTPDMQAHHEGMVEHHREMARQLGAMDARLDQLLATMNAASGQAKVDAMAAVLGELVAQRKQMTGMLVHGDPVALDAGAHDHGATKGADAGMDCCAGMKMDAAMTCCGDHASGKGMACCGGGKGKDAKGDAMSCGAGQACGGAAVAGADAQGCCCAASGSSGG